MTLKSMLNLNQPNLIRNPGLKLLVLTTEAGIFCVHRPLSCIYYILKMITFLAYVFFYIICARRLTSLCIVHCVLIFLCGFLLCTGCWIPSHDCCLSSLKEFVRFHLDLVVFMCSYLHMVLQWRNIVCSSRCCVLFCVALGCFCLVCTVFYKKCFSISGPS